MKKTKILTKAEKAKLIRINVRWESGEDIVLDGNHHLPKQAIKTIERSECISWYFHDVYKPIAYVLWNGKQSADECKFYLPEADLFDLEKLRKLATGDSFKNQKYAFFFYGVVERLLGQKVKSKGMSGLFAQL